MRKDILSLARDMAISIAIFIVVCIGILGIPTWTKTEDHAGYFSVATNPWGIAVFQEKKYGQYQFTHFSDYTIEGVTIHMTSKSSSKGPFTFGRDDIIFDSRGVIYTEPKGEELTFLMKLMGKPLTKYGSFERIISIPTQFFLINPDIPGVLEYRFPEGTLVTINRETKEITTNDVIHTMTMITHDEIDLNK